VLTFTKNTRFPISGKIVLPLLLACVYTFPGVVEAGEDPIPEYSKAYDPARDPFKDGNNALQFAVQTDRRVLIEVGGAWCPYCLNLDRFIAETPIVRDTLYKNFVVLKINVSEKNENREFLAGLPRTWGYPHIFIADSDGTILHSKDTVQLLHEGRYSPEKFVTYLNFWALANQTDDEKEPAR